MTVHVTVKMKLTEIWSKLGPPLTTLLSCRHIINVMKRNQRYAITMQQRAGAYAGLEREKKNSAWNKILILYLRSWPIQTTMHSTIEKNTRDDDHLREEEFQYSVAAAAIFRRRFSLWYHTNITSHHIINYTISTRSSHQGFWCCHPMIPLNPIWMFDPR